MLNHSSKLSGHWSFQSTVHDSYKENILHSSFFEPRIVILALTTMPPFFQLGDRMLPFFEKYVINLHPSSDGSIALAVNNKFIATFGGNSISFLDPSTLTRIGPVIEDGERLWSIAISADSSHIAIGQSGRIDTRDLSKILPDLYGPFHVSICAFIISVCQIIPMIINYIRHLLTRKYNKASNLCHRTVTTTRYVTLI